MKAYEGVALWLVRSILEHNLCIDSTSKAQPIPTLLLNAGSVSSTALRFPFVENDGGYKAYTNFAVGDQPVGIDYDNIFVHCGH